MPDNDYMLQRPAQAAIGPHVQRGSRVFMLVVLSIANTPARELANDVLRTFPSARRRGRRHVLAYHAKVKRIVVRMVETFLQTRSVSTRIERADLTGGPLRIEIRRGDFRVDGEGFASWKLNTAFALASDAGARLRKCPDEKCARYFLRMGRMEFCSSRCARRVYMRKWRRGASQ